ncbi:carbonic anhydrase [Verrucomicrobium sp. BvORR034]|uniref:carbonic anhydrase n=1 Tax=Verrucomicrobium sp. BvORR034 TaxID=1396418 RepID=UPI0006795D9B|nr:carbonic anhydrase [Verrucomicrobium sp. BvORR034]
MKIHRALFAAALLGSGAFTTSTIAADQAPAKTDTHAQAADEAQLTPAQALQRLKDGNNHFVANKPEHPHLTPKWRTQLATGQHPFAIVLGCADSRTAPEVVFDQGLGDLFVIRVAGNVLSDEILGSIEYAVEHLGSPLIVVLGHERCGAVKAARETIAAKSEAPGHVQSLVKAIEPAVVATANADAETTAKANVMNVVKALEKSGPFLSDKVAAGKVTVVGAHYDLDTGAVEFLTAK